MIGDIFLSMVDWSMVSLAAGLGWESEGDLFTAWLTNNDLLLVNSVGSINKLGNIETLVFNFVFTLDLSDLDRLGHTDLLGGRVGKHARDLKRSSDKRNLVSLGLVFLTAHLVFSMAIRLVTVAVSSSSTSSHFHCFALLIIGHLGGGAGGDNLLLFINIGTDLSLNCGGCLFAHCEDAVAAVVGGIPICWGMNISRGSSKESGYKE